MSEPLTPDHLREAEDAVIVRMREAISSPDLKDAAPGSVLEHVYDRVFSWLLTEAENIRKRDDAARASAPTSDTTCKAEVWDGPYRMTCNRLIVNGECSRHGKVAARASASTPDPDPDWLFVLKATHPIDGVFTAMSASNVERVCEVARRRVAASASNPDPAPGPFIAYFTQQGEGWIVTDRVRPAQTRIATVSTDPNDYGRANTLMIADALNRAARASDG